MIIKIPESQGRLALEEGTEKLTIQEHSKESGYNCYQASNDLPAADLLSLIDQGVKFEKYPFKIKIPASDMGRYLPDSLRSEGIDQISELPTPREYSEDETEVLIGAVVYNYRYMDQDELQWFRDQGFEILGKSDIKALYDSDPNWVREEEDLQ